MSKRRGSFLLSLAFLCILLAPSFLLAAGAATDDTVQKVICNVIKFVQGIGLPIMTAVILGSSVMAIFGRLAWPTIAMLIAFTAIFFGASAVVGKFATGLSADIANNSCDVVTGSAAPGKP